MQNMTPKSELYPLHQSGDIPGVRGEQTGPLASNPAEHDQPYGTLNGESSAEKTPFPPKPSRSHDQQHTPSRKELRYAVIAGVFTALLAMVITFVKAGTFHSVRQQIGRVLRKWVRLSTSGNKRNS